jgi:hypothetical protein
MGNKLGGQVENLDKLIRFWFIIRSIESIEEKE